MARFSDVLTIINGKNQKSVENPYGQYPIYGSGGIIGYANEFICDGETVIIGRKGSINKPIFVDVPFWNVDTAFGLSAKKNMLLPKYLYYFCEQFDFEKLNTTVTIPSLTKANLLNIELPLPSLDRQKKIVSVLDKLTTLISLRKQQLAKLDELVKARFVEMFGDININNKDWPTKKLEDLCDISRGSSPRPIEQFLGGTIPWIKIGDATNKDDIYLTSTKEAIIEEGVKKSRIVKKNSLIFANCGVSLGFARIVTFDGCIHDGWLAFENIDEQIDQIFLLKSLNQITQYFRDIAPAGTQPNLNISIMKEHKQVVPSLSLQKHFSNFVKQINLQKLTVQKSLDKMEILKRSLMQKFFGQQGEYI